MLRSSGSVLDSNSNMSRAQGGKHTHITSHAFSAFASATAPSLPMLFPLRLRKVMVWLASCHFKAWRTKGKHKQHRTHAQSRDLNVPAQTCVKYDSQCMMPCRIVSLHSVRCHYVTSGRRTEARLPSKRKSDQRPDMAASSRRTSLLCLRDLS